MYNHVPVNLYARSRLSQCDRITAHGGTGMLVITLAAQKGGAGKTTLATNLAVQAETSGQRTLLIDLDPQGSATSWYNDRPTETPKLIAIAAHEVAQAITKAKAVGFAVAILDTPGRDDAA